MSAERREQKQGQKTEYFNISTTNPEFVGNGFTEILNGEQGLAPFFASTQRARQSQPNNGDIIISGVSLEGHKAIQRIFDSLGDNPDIQSVRRALTESPLISWDKKPQDLK